jgi:hypothetical protein
MPNLVQLSLLELFCRGKSNSISIAISWTILLILSMQQLTGGLMPFIVQVSIQLNTCHLLICKPGFEHALFIYKAVVQLSLTI